MLLAESLRSLGLNVVACLHSMLCAEAPRYTPEVNISALTDCSSTAGSWRRSLTLELLPCKHQHRATRATGTARCSGAVSGTEEVVGTARMLQEQATKCRLVRSRADGYYVPFWSRG